MSQDDIKEQETSTAESVEPASGTSESPVTPGSEASQQPENADDKFQTVTIPDETGSDESVATPDEGGTPIETSEQGTQRNLEAEASKMSILEKRAKQAELEKDAMLADFREIYSDDSEAYEKFRASYNRKKPGTPLPPHSELFGSVAQSQLNNDGQQIPLTQADLFQLKEQIKQEAKQEVRQESQLEQEVSQGFKDFIAEIPEMNPESMTDEAKTVARDKYEQVQYIAASMKTIMPNLSMGEALVRAYRSLPGQMEQSIEQAKKAGELLGKHTAYAKGSAETTGISGGQASTNTGTSFKLTDAQKKRYEQLQKENPRIAKIFAQKAHEGNTGS